MSSLRRRAIWVQRAMSTERSSIGGPGQGADDGAGVGGIGQQPQPGEHVADLGALKEGGLADQAVGDRPLLERHPDRLPLVDDLGDEHRDPPRGHPSRASRRSMSTATAWAWERSLAQRHSSHLAGVRRGGRRGGPRRRPPAARAAAAARQTGSGQRCPASSSITSAASPAREARHPRRPGGPEAPQRGARVTGHGQPRAHRPPARESPPPGRAPGHRRSAGG